MTGPLDMDAVLTEFSAAISKGTTLGANAWLSWRRWRAEWSGQVVRLRWEADHFREMHLLRDPAAGMQPRTLEMVLQDLQQAAAMETLLDDVAQAIRWLGVKKGAKK